MFSLRLDHSTNKTMEKMNYQTEQEKFWAGDFGDEYIRRNVDTRLLASNVAMFAQILGRTEGVASVVELGANVGMNLRALRQLLPEAALAAVEINHKAATALREWGECKVQECSILEYQPQQQCDLAFVKGVLIHINPESLPRVYDLLFACSKRYILIVEYYNPTPMEVVYRGHQGKLFKRDFAGEFMERFPGVHLLDYKFVYRRDRNFPQDDSTWFLFEKQA